jgi:hypothetical protein
MEKTLREVNGLEFYEWREEGILKIQLTGKGVLSDEDGDKTLGSLLNPSHAALVLDEDCDVYKPESPDLLDMFGDGDDTKKRLLLSFRKNAIQEPSPGFFANALRGLAFPTENRGIAAGPVDVKRVRPLAQKSNHRFLPGNRLEYQLPDGSWAKTKVANIVRSGIAGNFDKSPRVPYCRKKYVETLEEARSFFLQVDGCFKQQAPDQWQMQSSFLDKTGIREKGWSLWDTVFTTITINRNFQTAAHRDAGDYEEGFGNLTVLGRPNKDYTGGQTCFPKFRVAANVRPGDFMAMDVHEVHGNFPIYDLNGQIEEDNATLGSIDCHYERMSIVCYARTGMAGCSSLEEEEGVRTVIMADYLKPVDKQAYNMAMNAAQKQKAEEEFTEMLELIGED